MDNIDSKKSNIIKIVILSIVVIALIGLTVWLMPFIVSLGAEENREKFKEWIISLGIGGWFILLGVQVVQVIVAFLPGEPIEILAGIIYGTWGGLFICILGLFIGTASVFLLVKKFGYPLVSIFFDNEKVKKYKFLNDPAKFESLIFILFFIPGTPKDILTYLAGLTPIKPLKFLSLSLVARMPSVVTSTFAGSSLMEGKWVQALIMFLITGIVGIAGIIINNRLLNRINSKKDNDVS